MVHGNTHLDMALSEKIITHSLTEDAVHQWALATPQETILELGLE